MTRSRSLAFAAAAALLFALVAAFAPTPEPAAAAGLISIRIHNCAATYDGANSTIYDLAADCHDPGAGLTVALSRDNTPVATMTADANGWLNFANFQARKRKYLLSLIDTIAFNDDTLDRPARRRRGCGLRGRGFGLRESSQGRQHQ